MSQLRKWLTFCDKDYCCPLPETERDVIAYVEYILPENRISLVPLPKYITNVSQYYELNYFQMYAQTPILRALVKAYSPLHPTRKPPALMCIAFKAALMHHVLAVGMGCASVRDIGHFVAVLFSFILHLRYTSVWLVAPDDTRISISGLSVSFRKNKGK